MILWLSTAWRLGGVIGLEWTSRPARMANAETMNWQPLQARRQRWPGGEWLALVESGSGSDPDGLDLPGVPGLRANFVLARHRGSWSVRASRRLLYERLEKDAGQAACEGGPKARFRHVPGCIAARTFPARSSFRPWWSNRFPVCCLS